MLEGYVDPRHGLVEEPGLAWVKGGGHIHLSWFAYTAAAGCTPMGVDLKLRSGTAGARGGHEPSSKQAVATSVRDIPPPPSMGGNHATNTRNCGPANLTASQNY